MRDEIKCSFCGEPSKVAKIIITNGKDSMCEVCIADCEEMFSEEPNPILKRSVRKKKTEYTKVKEFDNVFKAKFGD